MPGRPALSCCARSSNVACRASSAASRRSAVTSRSSALRSRSSALRSRSSALRSRSSAVRSRSSAVRSRSRPSSREVSRRIGLGTRCTAVEHRFRTRHPDVRHLRCPAAHRSRVHRRPAATGRYRRSPSGRATCEPGRPTGPATGDGVRGEGAIPRGSLLGRRRRRVGEPPVHPGGEDEGDPRSAGDVRAPVDPRREEVGAWRRAGLRHPGVRRARAPWHVDGVTACRRPPETKARHARTSSSASVGCSPRSTSTVMPSARSRAPAPPTGPGTKPGPGTRARRPTPEDPSPETAPGDRARQVLHVSTYVRTIGP